MSYNSRSYPFKINCQRDNFAGGFRKGSALSMISLKQPLKLMEKPIGSIKLALKPPSKSDKCMVAGWGLIHRNVQNSRSYPYKLHEASVQIRDFDQ